MATTTEVEKVSTFKEGFVNGIICRSNRDGTNAFNLENLIGTIGHAAIGALGGYFAGKAYKTNNPNKLASLPSMSKSFTRV